MLKHINQIVVFVMELIMLVTFAYYGFHRNTTAFNRYLLTISLPVVAIILWGVLAAPKSSNRLDMPYLAIFRACMFLAASLALYVSDFRMLAITMAALTIVTQVFSYSIGE